MTEGTEGDAEPVSATIVRDVGAAFVLALGGLSHAVAFALLVFAGPLADEVPRAVGTFGVAAAVTTVYTGLRSRLAPAFSILQDGPGVVLIAVAAAIAATSDGDAADVVVMLALTSLVAGVLMWLIGRLRLGRLVRYMPTTVVAAFLGATGCLLLRGGFEVMIDHPLGLDELHHLWGDGNVELWAPGLALGVVLLAISRARLHASLLSVAILVSIGLFFAIALSVSSIEQVEAANWLIGPFPDGAGAQLVTPAEVVDASWDVIVGEYAGIAGAIGVAVLVAMLNVSAVGYVTGQRVEVDAELRTAGVGNVVLAPFGVIPGFLALGDTTLATELAPGRRVVAVLAGVMTGALALFGIGLLGSVPRFAIGGSLILVGVALLGDWVHDLRRSPGRTDQVIGVAIVAMTAAVGILEGIAVGVVAACAVFVVRSSRLDPIRRTGSLHDFQSQVDRPAAEQSTLMAMGDRVLVLELHGHLFFGSVTTLEDRVVELADGLAAPPEPTDLHRLEVVVVDFRSVTGVDSSALPAIDALAATLAERGTAVVFTGASDGFRDAWNAGREEASAVSWRETLDHGLEQAEDVVLAVAEADDASAASAATTATSAGPGLSGELLGAFVERSFEAGEVAMRHGAPGDHMFIVVEGSMTAFQVTADGGRHRLRRFGAGALVGEIALLTGGERSAEIVADVDSTVLMLTVDRYEQMRRDEPQLALELQDHMLLTQAARVVSLSQGLARFAG